MSLPRRTPPSQMISSAADGVGDRGDEVEDRRRAVELAATVVGQGDRLDPVFDGELGIVDGLHALEHDRSVPDRAEPLDVVPRQRWVELRRDLLGEGDRPRAVVVVAADLRRGDVGEQDRLGSDEAPRPARVDDAVDDRVESELRRHREAAPDVAFPAAELGGVDGDDERLVAGGRGPLDHVAHQSAVPPDVHLEPTASVPVRGGDLLDRTSRHRRQRVRHAGSLRRPGDGQLALRVGDPRVARRCEHERERQRTSRAASMWCRRWTRRGAPVGRTRSCRTRPDWPASPVRPRRRRRCSRTPRPEVGAWRSVASRRRSPPSPAGASPNRTRSGGTGGRSAECRAW